MKVELSEFNQNVAKVDLRLFPTEAKLVSFEKIAVGLSKEVVDPQTKNLRCGSWKW